MPIRTVASYSFGVKEETSGKTLSTSYRKQLVDVSKGRDLVLLGKS